MTTDSTERYSRANGLIIGILAAAVIVLVATLFRTCNQATDSTGPQYTIDSLQTALRHSQDLFARQTRMNNDIITDRTHLADSLQKQYDSAKRVIVVKGKELLALNERTKASKTTADTTDYSRHCDSLTTSIDSLEKVAWDYGRRTDSLLFVNDDLKQLQAKQISAYEGQLNKERQSYNGIMQSYAAQHVYDSLLIKKGKRGRWKDMGKGAAIWEAVRQVANLFIK